MAQLAQPIPLEHEPLSTRGVTLRSFVLGTLAVIFVCGLTPYNDFVLSDTTLTGGFMPVAAVLVEFFLIVVLNAVLLKINPRWAISGRELAVIVLMTLLACALPEWGLAKFLVPMPVTPFKLGQEDPTMWKAFIAMGLPHWLFPLPVNDESVSNGVVQWFFNRVPEGNKIPWAVWMKPAIGWGVFVAAMVATWVTIGRMLMDQWHENERLPFPLVDAHSQLIEPPAPGHAMNALFRNPWLWIGLVGVICIHTLNCFHDRYPRYFPQIPVGYNFTNSLFANEPFSLIRSKIKSATLSFTVVGVAYFVRSRTAFSMIVVFLVISVFDFQTSMMGVSLPSAAWADEHMGACAAFILGMFWIGRHHWVRIFRNAVGMGIKGESTYRVSFWIAIAGIAVMFAWLSTVGVSPWMAALIVVFVISAHIIVSRIVAETGLPWFRTSINTAQIYTLLPIRSVSSADVYFSGVFNVLGSLSTRDSIMAFTQQGLGVVKTRGVQEKERFGIGAMILWTLLLGTVISTLGTLYCQYSYPTPTDRATFPQRNNFGALYVPKRDITDPLSAYADAKARPGGQFAAKSHSPLLHMGIGFSIVTLLQAATFRWASWPILPVGFVCSYGSFIENAWFSIFIGWAAKALIVRFGGASMYGKIKPLFVGMIFGECLAGAGLLIVNAIIIFSGGDPLTMKFML